MSVLQTGPYAPDGAAFGVHISGVPGTERHVAALDADGATAQVSTVAINGATNSSTYTLRIDDTTPGTAGRSWTISAETDGDATQTELRDALFDAFLDSSSDVFTLVHVSKGTNQLLITGSTVEARFTVTLTANPNADLAVSTVAGAGFGQYLYGRAYEVVEVGQVGPLSGPILAKTAVRRPQLPTRAALVFDVDTNANSQSTTAIIAYTPYGGTVQMRTVTAASGADAAATAAAIETALGTAFPEAVVVEESPEVTATFRAGDQVSVVSVTNSGGLVVTATASAGGAIPEFAICIQEGCSEYGTLQGPQGPTAALAPLVALRSTGHVYSVPCPSGVADPRGQAYVETDGASAGLIFTASGATRIPIPNFRFDGLDASDARRARGAFQ